MNINKIRQTVMGERGLASSNKYQISFLLGKEGDGTLRNSIERSGLTRFSAVDPITYESNENPVNDSGLVLSYLADEVNIPGYSVATGEHKGIRPGINIRYAHTRNFNECTIAFLLDMKHTPLKFLRAWSDYMFGFDKDNGNSAAGTKFSIMPMYDDYTCEIVIDKLEPIRSDRSRLSAASSKDTHDVVSRIRLKKAYPYLVNDITVNNGPNQPIRFQATFYYEYSYVSDK
jgi:hypothetical protein